MTNKHLAGATQADPSAVHAAAFVFDACIPGMGFFREPEAEIDAILGGGVSGANVTVAQQQHNFESAVLSINALEKVADRFAERVKVCTSVDELLACKKDSRLGLVIHFQDAKPLSDNLEYVETFYRLGLRVLQLTYNDQGWLGTGICEVSDGGLSNLGRQVVTECNRLGIAIDVSHCGPRTTADAIEHSDSPVAVTHTGAHSRVPAGGRNKPLDLLRAIAESGGVAGVLWFPALIKRVDESDRVAQADVSDVLNHVEDLIDVMGIDHVGVGSDLSNFHARTLEMPAASSLLWYRKRRPDVFGDGPVDRYDRFPTGLDSHTGMTNLTRGLIERGYKREEVEKVLGGNWLSFLGQVWSGNRRR